MSALAARPTDGVRFGTVGRVGLVERVDELASLRAAWEQAAAGRGGLVLVSGDPGVGKSALVDAFVDDLDATVPALWGACDPLATPRPLGPVHDMAGGLGQAVQDLLRDAQQPHAIYAGVFERLQAEPTVAVLEDLHWADQGTIDLLRFALRRLAGAPSLVVVTLRDDEIGPSHSVRALLGDVARSPVARVLQLRPLSVDGVAALVRDRPVDAARLHQVTAGNPFFVVEMLAHDGDDLPPTVRDAILARTAGLDASAWDVLHLLACSPEAIPDHLLAALHVPLPPLRALDDAGLIQRRHRGLDFRHDLYRMAVAGSIPPGGDVAIHRRMLEALEASSLADPAVLVHHARGAGDAARTRRYATQAARQASRSGAHRQAEELFRLALEHRPIPPDAEAQLLEQLAIESYLLDHLDDAIEAAGRAMALHEQLGDVEAVSANLHDLAVYEWYNANRDVAEAHASQALAVLGRVDTVTASTLVRTGHALAIQAFLAVQANDLARARDLVEQATDVAARVDDRPLHVRVGLIGGARATTAGEPDGRTRMVSILGSASDALFDEIYSSGYSHLSFLDVEQRRFAEARELLATSIPLTVERDLPVCHAWQLGSRGRLRFLLGEWDDASVDAEHVLAGPSAPLARTWPHLVRGLLHLRRTGGTSVDLDAAWSLANRYGEPLRLLHAAAAIVELAWLTEQPDGRLPTIRTLPEELRRPGLEWARGELVVWLRRLDGSARAEPMEPLGDIAEPHRLHVIGALDDAAAAWARLDARYERALTLVETGDADRVGEGLDELDRLGADAVAAKLRRDLRARGMIVSAPRRRSTLAHPSGLTTRELEVLGLLDDGLTNAEIAQQLYVSRKTVDHHVSAILTKLGAANRREAVRTARRAGIVA